MLENTSSKWNQTDRTGHLMPGTNKLKRVIFLSMFQCHILSSSIKTTTKLQNQKSFIACNYFAILQHCAKNSFYISCCTFIFQRLCFWCLEQRLARIMSMLVLQRRQQVVTIICFMTYQSLLRTYSHASDKVVLSIFSLCLRNRAC